MVVLATKLYVGGTARDRAIDSLRSLIENDIGGVDVEWSVGVRSDGFPSVTIDGPDAVIARNVLSDQWGTITPSFESGEEYVGTLTAWDDDGLTLDVGDSVSADPALSIDADGTVRIPTDQLGLGPGTATEIRTRFGLVQHLPLRFVPGDPPRLADSERDRLYEWTRGTGRVNVNSATRAEVRATVNRAGHADDIVTIERLGLLEQSIVCREQTDPPGLLAAIGRHLPAELLCVLP
ncbi:DUF2110 family protein [Halocatena pleomorpha]|uniref:DUF2110 family protein n=1 Tax=Halocatena pleomorpha TaxID=1785090 RepID=A0A3P3RHT9_9EURY|nr:DUF2110 family protein [Halocatena pleomorpha]RRJ33137.1 DUF2110 family protein [Halocatena pleomorpha]